MSVRARKNSIQIDFYYRSVRCRETIPMQPTKANLRYADNLLATIKHEIAINAFEYRRYFPNSKSHSAMIFGNPLAGNLTVEMALRSYFESRQRDWKKSTRQTNLQIIESHLIPAFRDVRLVDLNVGMIRKWISGLSCGTKRINNILIPLRGMLKDVHADGLVEQNPMDRIHNYKVRTREPKPFTSDERKKILDALPDQVRNFFRFAFYTGLRTGELIALRWSDIDFDNLVVRVRRSISRQEESTTKTAAGERDVVLFEPAIEALNDQKKFTFKLDDRVFHNPFTGKQWSNDGAVWKSWKTAFEKIDVPYRQPYQTRHTYASSLLSSGEHPSWIAKQMGHTDPSVLFKRYGRWMPEMYPNAGDKIRGRWSQNGH